MSESKSTAEGIDLTSKLFATTERVFREHNLRLNPESQSWVWNYVSKYSDELNVRNANETLLEKDLMAEANIKLFAFAVISYSASRGELGLPELNDVKRILCPFFPFLCDD